MVVPSPLAGFVAGVLLASLTSSGASGDPVAFEGPVQAQVVRVVDGDTFEASAVI